MSRFASTVLVLAAMTLPAWAIDDTHGTPPKRVVQKGKGAAACWEEARGLLLAEGVIMANTPTAQALLLLQSQWLSADPATVSPPSCSGSPS
jgi:hypothetical protein